jgi:hypothetical protein
MHGLLHEMQKTPNHQDLCGKQPIYAWEAEKQIKIAPLRAIQEVRYSQL